MHKSISILLTVLLLLSVAHTLAQQLPKFEWAKQTARGTGDEYSWEVTTDASGNVFSIGAHTAITDFDPGAGTVELDAAIDGPPFISKLAADGTFLWVKTVNATGVYGVVTDAAGNVYITGTFLGTTDFDPGPGVFNLSNTNRDLFVLKLDRDGNFVWAKNFDPEYGNTIAYDPAGFVLIGASRSSSSQCSVIKLDATDGTHIWTRSLGPGTGASTVLVGASGNVVATGFLTGTSDFDPGPGTFNLTSTGVDLFVWKLDGNGDFIWARQIATSAAIDVMKSHGSIDGAENIYLTQNFIGPQDFDPGPGTFTINGSGMFVCKLDAFGDFGWAKVVSSGTAPNFISTDPSGNSYITGQFAGTVDFNPGPGTFNLTHAGNGDTFILNLDAAGDFVWATRTGSPSEDEGTAIHADATGHVYLTSYFYQFADFDPTCTNLNLTARNNGDTYIQKLSNVIQPTITSFSPTNGSPGTEVTINGSGFSPTPSNNTVRFFNGRTATVTASTATSITATAPMGIATGKIAVTVGCYIGLSAADFVLPSCAEKLFDFTGGTTSGREPWGSLVSDGTFLYGMTIEGGVNDRGLIFKISKDGTGFTKVLDFEGSTTGSFPQGSLIYDGSFLYGMTVTGGVNNLGAIFKIRTDGTGFTKLFDFDGATSGRYPEGSLFSDGNFLYGMTSGGGLNDQGTIFKIMTDGTGYVKLLDFAATANGSAPLGSLISDGTFLYGMASGGGTSGRGTIFKIRPDGTEFVKLLNFTSSIGSDPLGDLVSDGTFLYGMTSGGGTNGDGTIFKIRPDGTGYARLLNFNVSTNGDSPFASLILSGSTLYGMTYRGIGSAFGTVFRINTDGTSHTVLCSLPMESDGAYPSGSLILDGGVLYGMTQLGGVNDMGVVFRLAVAASLPTIASFTPSSGPVGTTVTITGTNFSPTPANNVVTINGFAASVISSTATSITILVPSDATTGKITVTVSGNTATSSTDFIVAPPSSPVITSFSPSQGPEGSTVIIDGTNFSATPADNIVAFNGVAAVVTASTSTSITTSVPPGATTGPITVTVSGNTATSSTDFIVTIPSILINTQPSDASVCENSAATFTASATGTTNITYQWQFSSTSTGTFIDIVNGTNYSNASTSTVTINTSGNFGAGFYRCKVDGDLTSTVFTNAASLAIQAAPSPPSTSPTSRCGQGSLTLQASGGVDGQYRWFTQPVNGTPIPGEVNRSYTTPSLPATSNFFVANVIGGCESSRTQATATIIQTPATPTATGASACPGSTLTLNASGGLNGQYKWYTDATTLTPLPGEVNNSYTTPILSQTSTYYVTVTDNGCESNRTPVEATIVTSGCAPEIEQASLTTQVEGTIIIDLKLLISTVGTLDVSSIKVTIGPSSGAIASIENGVLTITYTGVNFGGSESITIEACNTNGLCSQQNFTIEVNGEIIIYNAVSPNDDGKNERLVLQYIDAIPSTRSNKVTIYNRWGDEVFSISDYDNNTRAFTGRNKDGNQLPSGTYYYKIYFPLQDKTVTGFLSVKY